MSEKKYNPNSSEAVERNKKFATHKLGELITLLQNIKAQEGDLPVIYWDQFSTVKMAPDELVQIHDSIVYFGGFHVNGAQFNEHDRNVMDPDSERTIIEPNLEEDPQ